MILAFDTHYFNTKAKTVCIAFDSWVETENYKVFSQITENIETYKSGEFYKRELPCILSLLEKMDYNPVEVIIIDGFVFLDDDNKLGLGGHLFESLERKIPVIGVAKSNYLMIEDNKRALKRGQSERPLFITAVGVDLDDATKKIRDMGGTNRIPTLLKKLDTLTKEKGL